MLPNQEIVPNVLKEKGVDDFFHGTIFSILQQTPAFIEKNMQSGVHSLDMQMGHLAKVLSKRKIKLGFGLVIVDSVTLSEGTQNIGGWGDSYYVENAVSFPTKVFNDLSKTDKAVLSLHNTGLELSAKGGVDFTFANMNLQTRNGSGEINFKIDPKMLQKLQNVPGFVPMIINIQPMTDFRQFLELADNQSAAHTI